jgi:sugar phosphate isomerase/epimerase
MKLSFSTLGCPDWPLDTIMTKAKDYGFDGIGVRGIMGEMILNKIPEFSKKDRAATLARFREMNLAIVMMLGGSKFTSPDKTERAANVKAARDDIDLAAAMDSRMIRVYGGKIPEGVSKDDAYRWVVESFRELGDYGGKKGVYTCIETHDDFTDTYLVKEIIERTDNEYVRVLWDVHHPFRTCGQTMKEAYENVGPYTMHTHFKDSYKTGEVEEGFKYCLLGDGDVPNQEALQLLKDGGYTGYLSLEWEKKWKPYLPEATVGFPQFVTKMKEYLAALK